MTEDTERGRLSQNFTGIHCIFPFATCHSPLRTPLKRLVLDVRVLSEGHWKHNQETHAEIQQNTKTGHVGNKSPIFFNNTHSAGSGC